MVTRAALLEYLDAFAPPELAESWDNVGLIVDAETRPVLRRIGLAIELTEATLREALEGQIDFLLCYHPPIFSGLKKLSAESGNSRLVARALLGGLSIYSPHTAFDAAAGGMGDWLAGCLGPGEVSPIVPHLSPRFSGLGAGRRVELHAPVSSNELISRLKDYLGLSRLRYASPSGESEIRTLAVCPGAGGSLFEKVGKVDLLVTGEMRHHDVLARVAEGTRVVLTEHTNSERGYLPYFADRLRAAFPSLTVALLSSDRDPLTSV